MSSSLPYRPDIQSLRAIAVLSVVMFHFNKHLLPGGFIGVDIFFIISGYLITSIILRQKENKSFSFFNFYTSRIKRIVPAYLFLLLVVTIGAIILFTPEDFLNFKALLRQCFIFNANNYLPEAINDYFGTRAEQTSLLHTWTLSIEMQFYLALPILLVFIKRDWNKYIFFILTILLTAYSQYHIQRGDKQEMYFSLLARAPEFLLGSLMILWRCEEKISVKIANILSLIGLMLIIFSLALITETSGFPGLLYLAPCIGCVFIVVSNKSLFNKAISIKPLIYIGSLSYSIYLWHWPVLAFIRYYTDNYILHTKLIFISLFAISIFSWLSYIFIEIPFKNIKNYKNLALRLIPLILSVVSLSIVAKSINYKLTNISDEILLPNALGLENHNIAGKTIIRGDTTSTRQFLLIGDSHALHLNPFFDVIGKTNNFKFRSFTFDVFINVPTFNINTTEIPKVKIDAWNKQQAILRPIIDKSDIIVIAGFWKNQDPARIKSLDNFCKSVSKNQQIVIVSDVATLSANPIKYQRFKKLGLPVGAFKNIYHPADYNFIFKLINKYHNVHFLDLRKSAFFKSTDFPFLKGISLYYDSGHLNARGSQLYGEIESKNVMKVLNPLFIKTGNNNRN